MRTLFLTIFFPPSVGGVQSYSYDLVSNLCRLGEEVVVVAPNGKEAAEVDASLPCPVIRISSRAGCREGAMAWQTFRILSRQRFDRVFCSDWKPSGLLALLASRVVRVPYFLAAHGSELLDDYNARHPTKAIIFRQLRRFRRRVFHDAAAVFPVSRYTGDLVRELGISPTKISVVPNGVETMRFFPQDKKTPLAERYGLGGKKVILTVARLDNYKGHDVVIRALPRVLHDVPDAVYLIVGTGPERPRLESLASEVGVRPNVIFAGHVPTADLCAHYHLADVFVMLSRKAPDEVEGFGLTFLEANACGKPVIGGSSGGTAEAVVDGETGLLIDPADVSTAAAMLVRLLTDGDLASRLGRQGLARARNELSWAVQAAKIRQIMNDSSGLVHRTSQLMVTGR
ncbi:MAG: glycosyltransferase family 4 protein [Chloroflexi bacterium]|nr:glycosyltransferase family 4 protein [Chloroflexota bacterium]